MSLFLCQLNFLLNSLFEYITGILQFLVNVPTSAMHIFSQLEMHLGTLCLTGKRRDLWKGMILLLLNLEV